MTIIDVHDEWDDPRQYRLWDAEDVELFEAPDPPGPEAEADRDDDREASWSREDWERPWG